MRQVTWRAADDVVDAVQRAAQHAGRSANDWITLVLRAATDPELAGADVLRVRERLRAAGILEDPGAPALDEPDVDAVAAARRRAGRGRPLADFVADGRGR